MTLSNVMDLLIVVASPYTPGVALLAVALFTACRRRWLAVAAASVLVAAVVIQAQWYWNSPPQDSEQQRIALRVLSSNLRKGHADPHFVARLARNEADVIAVSELTPDAVAGLRRAGLDQVFPYAVIRPEPGAGGIGLWSRFPLSRIPEVRSNKVTIETARIQVPGIRSDLVFASLHVTSPLTAEPGSFRRWRLAIEETRKLLDQLADTAQSSAIIVAGDFNSTPDMRQYRDLLTNGYRDAAQQAGSGFAPTFPSGAWRLPFLTIDHVLVRDSTATSLRTVSIPGSDHRALLTTVEIPVMAATRSQS